MPVVRLLTVVSRVVTIGFETVPSAATANRTRSEDWGNHNDVPVRDHSGPSAATVPSPIGASDPTPVPTCWTILLVSRSMMVRKPVNVFQVRAARNLPLGLIDDDSKRPFFTSRRLPSGVMR